MLRLKKVLQDLRISQASVARALSISEGAFAQIVNHNQWPKKPNEKALRVKILGFLTRYNADSDTVFQLELECCNTPAPDRTSNQSQEDIDMLLRKQTLTPAAKKAFGLIRNPFADIESADGMWISPDIRYVREHMMATARHGGFLAVVGESGAGKTSVCIDLEDRIARESLPIVVIKPYVLSAEDNDKKGKTLKSTHIAEALLRAVAPLAPVKASPEARFAQLHKALIDSHNSGYKHVLIIEEAHSMPIPTLKHLKRIMELQVGFTKLVSIILIGQPELLKKLSEKNAEVREVVQRCEVVTLPPVEPGRLREFLDHRLATFDKKSNQLIDESGVAALVSRLASSSGASQLYPLAIGNFIVAALNTAAAACEPIVNQAVIAEVV